jgi:SAM-dependent methyltransferase
MSWRHWVKAPLRPLASPLLRRLEARIDSRTHQRLAEVDAALTVIRAEFDGFNRSIPLLLGSVSAQGAGERSFRRSLDELGRRVEFVRKEVLFELRYGQRPGQESEGADVEGRVVNLAKLARMQGSIRLNLGAGHVGKAEHLNVDARALDDIDVVADIRHLPFEKGTIAEIYSAHVLEHFPIEELRTVLLPYWASLLRPGGEFVAVVPDMETMINEYVAGRMDFEELREVTYGTQEYEGDFHYNGFSQASLRALLETSGLTDVSIRASARRNGMCYEMEIVGVRSAAAAPG